MLGYPEQEVTMKTIGGKTLNEIMSKVTYRKQDKVRVRYKTAKFEGRKISRHRKIAMNALGKKLPPGAVVHHLDLDPFNNDPTNLVVCPDLEYRRLLIERTRAVARGDVAAWLVSFLGLKTNS